MHFARRRRAYRNVSHCRVIAIPEYGPEYDYDFWAVDFLVRETSAHTHDAPERYSPKIVQHTAEGCRFSAQFVSAEGAPMSMEISFGSISFRPVVVGRCFLQFLYFYN